MYHFPYIPYEHCYLWQTNLVGLHVLSDALIAIAYFSIPLMLAYFARQRTDIPFPGVFILFSLFVISCATAYLMAIWTLWHPDYWLSGAIKALTALISVFTAFTLLTTIPKVLALPSAAVLRQINHQLENQIEERKRAETELRASRERWQLAIIGSNDGIWDRDIANNELFLSPRFKQMLGYGDHELANRREVWIQHIHPSDRERVLAANQEHIVQKTPFYTAKYRLLCKDGSYRWFLDRAKALRDSAGNAVRMTGSIRDITASKRAEVELQRLNQELETRIEERTAAVTKSERRFRSLFEAAPDLLYVLYRQGVILQVNSTAIARSGYTQEEMVGRSIVSFSPAEAHADVYRSMATLLSESSCRHEFVFVCKNAQILTMDCACTLVEDDLTDDYILLQQRDITAKKQAEQERIQLLVTLEESERRWQSFLEKVRLMVVGLDLSGQIDYVNPYFLERTGYSKETVLGSDWVDSFLPKSQQQCARQIFQDIFARKDPSNYQSHLITHSGDQHVISWNSTLLQDAKGQPVRTLSIGEDITERDAIDRMKNEFISVVSHELRTPLTSIHGALDLLHSGLVDPSSNKGQHVLSIAVDNSNRLVKLVNDILELERLESGKIRLRPKTISTGRIVQEAYEAIELMAERAEVTLEIASSDLRLCADRDRVIQVLINLLGNAIKFSEPLSTVRLAVEQISDGTSKGTDYIRFAVIDQGRGIPADRIDTIFERFHQVDASDSRSKGGTGLGLAISRSIVRQHGGDIWAESTLGEGSCFYFTIPQRCELAHERSP